MIRCSRPVVAVVLAAASLAAHAQSYPSKPVRVVVAFAAGGTTDIVARAYSQKLSEALRYQFVVDNRPGAGGTIGTDIVAKSPPDGHTLNVGSTSSIAVNVSLYSRLPYDPVRDLAPVVQMASAPFVLAIHPSVPAKTVKELIALARAKPGQLNFASSGNGTSLHLVAEYLKHLAKIEMVHIPYKGVGAALPDLVAGQVQIMFSDMAPFAPFVKAGKLRALAVTSAKRSAVLPDLPTIAESGVRGFDLSGWYGFLAPAGTPREVVSRLNGEIIKIARTPAMKERYATLGLDPFESTPEQFGAFIKSEIAKWGEIVRRSGTKLE